MHIFLYLEVHEIKGVGNCEVSVTVRVQIGCRIF